MQFDVKYYFLYCYLLSVLFVNCTSIIMDSIKEIFFFMLLSQTMKLISSTTTPCTLIIVVDLPFYSMTLRFLDIHNPPGQSQYLLRLQVHHQLLLRYMYLCYL